MRKFIIAGAPASLLFAAVQAQAALSTAVSDAIPAAYTDVGTAVGLMTVGAAVLWGARKVLSIFGR
jgi:hypothetical protein